MTQSILFVDSPAHQDASLGRQFLSLYPAGQVVSAATGAEALRALKDRPFRVLVTGTRLPDMDGMALLKLVRRIAPQTIRMVLVPLAERERHRQVSADAHQAVLQPCEARALANYVARAIRLEDALEREALHGLLGDSDSLPALPKMYQDLVDAIANPDSGAADIAEIIRQDIGMTAKTLQLANSAYFAPAQPITNVRVAAAYLGFNLIKNLVMTLTLFRHVDRAQAGPECDPEAIQAHAFRVATVSAMLMRRRPEEEDAFTAGMLHDAGKLILLAAEPLRMRQARDRSRAQGGSVQAAERDILRITHAEAGGYLLRAWGLPYPIVEAVTQHHTPTPAADTPFDITAAVYLANLLVGQWEVETGRRRAGTTDALDPAWAESLGIAHRIEAWQTEAVRRCEDGCASGIPREAVFR